jgi:hypothetical protein
LNPPPPEKKSGGTPLNVTKVANSHKWTSWYGILKEEEVEEKTFRRKQH